MIALAVGFNKPGQPGQCGTCWRASNCRRPAPGKGNECKAAQNGGDGAVYVMHNTCGSDPSKPNGPCNVQGGSKAEYGSDTVMDVCMQSSGAQKWWGGKDAGVNLADMVQVDCETALPGVKTTGICNWGGPAYKGGPGLIPAGATGGC